LKVKDVLAAYRQHCATEGAHCPKTTRQVEITLSLFAQAHGELDVSEMKPAHLVVWAQAQTGWKSRGTRGVHMARVKAALGWAARLELIGRHPFQSVTCGKSERRPAMADQALEGLYGAANKALERALRFLRLTMCRQAELCEARVADLDFARGVWVVDRHKSRKFTGRAKIIPLTEEALELLRETLAVGTVAVAGTGAAVVEGVETVPAGDRHVFLNNRGTPWTPAALRNGLCRLRARGIDTGGASLHGIRGRGISDAIANGASIKLVAEAVGHRSVTTTERYIHLDDKLEDVRAAAQKGMPAKGRRRGAIGA